MQLPRILIVDDDTSLRTALFRALDRKGYQVITAASKAEALQLGQSDRPADLVLCDLRLPDGDGIDFMNEFKRTNTASLFIVLTGFGTIDAAVRATKNGAEHFITKPFELNEILNLVDKTLAHKRLERENIQLRSALHKKYRFDNIVGQSDGVTQVLELVERVAAADSTVLITGESGTGKELVAKAIHFNSNRASKPFVPINCGAIPGELLESELFGHIKGAFTGAVSNRVGRFELAEGGTVFFDEIGDMSPQLQIKLLRVLQERKYEPVGSTKTFSSDVRIIAATNVNLENAVKEGRFREDLYYRLNVIPLHIPALRERKSDIPLLFHYYMEYFNEGKKEKLTGITPAAMEFLNNYEWPGNIRELENLVERLAILKNGGLVDVNDLPEKYKGQNTTTMTATSSLDVKSTINIPPEDIDFNTAVDAFENALIMRALEKTGWNRNQAALLLKLNRTTLVEKIKKKGLRPELTIG
ncbi:MAG: Fis family transcriptional regulator [Bdellovibrionales bacterium RBG_16_40_8]|nr:MAG: Fis family transcriptional regulator [Bdellovibrionales bacterium RBG_16_40_8]